MLTSSDTPLKIGYFSVLRYVPDPVREEALNVGLFLVDADGEWARFDGEVPRGLVRQLSGARHVVRLQDWIARTKNVYAPIGARPLVPATGHIGLETLREWAAEFGAALRLTEPKAAVGESLDGLWRDLYRQYVRRRNRMGEELESAGSRQAISASTERRRVSAAFVREIRRWPNFDRDRLRLSELFPGRRASHQADVAILNGKVTAVARTLPIVYGTEEDMINARALLIDAAVDLDPAVVKLGLHDDPPADRAELLKETTSLLGEVKVMSVTRREFAELEARFSNIFFPEHDEG